MSDTTTQVFDLGRESTHTEIGKDKKEVKKTETSYPSVYIWQSPPELTRLLAKAGKEGVMISAKVVPVSASEQTILKDRSCGPCNVVGEDETKKPTPREESSVEFEIHTIEITGAAEESDKESESDESTAGQEDLIVKAAKKLGIATD